MTVFVIVAAIALLIQAGLLYAMFKSAKAVEQHTARVMPKIEVLLPKVDALVEASRVALDEGRRQMTDIGSRTTEILEMTRAQLARVDEFMEDATGRARLQLDRAELVLDDTMNRVQETVALVHNGVMKPLRQIQGITAGVQAALNFLLRRRSGSPIGATVDEEMFI